MVAFFYQSNDIMNVNYKPKYEKYKSKYINLKQFTNNYDDVIVSNNDFFLHHTYTRN